MKVLHSNQQIMSFFYKVTCFSTLSIFFCVCKQSLSVHVSYIFGVNPQATFKSHPLTSLSIQYKNYESKLNERSVHLKKHLT